MANETGRTGPVEPEWDSQVCQGCLSTDRHMTTLRDNMELFLYLLEQPQNTLECDILLCWECLALIRRIQRFQIQIQRAQCFLKQYFYQSRNWVSLSTLATTSVLTLDSVHIQTPSEGDKRVLKRKRCALKHGKQSVEKNKLNVSHQGAHEKILENPMTRKSARISNKQFILSAVPKKEENYGHKIVKREGSRITRLLSRRFAKEASLIANPGFMVQTNDDFSNTCDCAKNIDKEKRQQEFPVDIEIEFDTGVTNNNSGISEGSNGDVQIIEDELCDIEHDNKTTNDKEVIKQELVKLQHQTKSTENINIITNQESTIHTKDADSFIDAELDRDEIKEIESSVKANTESADKVNIKIIIEKLTNNEKGSEIQKPDEDNFTDTNLSTDIISDSEETISETENKRRHESYAIITDNKEINIETVDDYNTTIHLEIEEMEHMAANESYRFAKSYMCAICKVKFKKKVDLKRHKTFRHMSQYKGPYTCTECNTRVATFGQLRAHWEESHNDAYKCNVCGYVTRHYFQMKDHILANHGKVYTCPVCNVEFSSVLDFGKHHKEFHDFVNITINQEPSLQTKDKAPVTDPELDSGGITDEEVQDENASNIERQYNNVTDTANININPPSEITNKEDDESSSVEFDTEEITDTIEVDGENPVKGTRKSNRFANKARVTYHHCSEIQQKDDEDSDVEFDSEEIKEIKSSVKTKRKTADKVNLSTNEKVNNNKKNSEIYKTGKDNLTDTDLSSDGIKDSEETIQETKKRRHESHAIITDNKEINIETVDDYNTTILLDVEQMEHMAANESYKFGKEHSCALCKIKFKKKMDWNRHKTFKHMSQYKGPYTCIECSTSVATFAQLGAHWEGSHNDAYKCKLCDYVTRHYFMMKVHILTKHGKVYTCRVCNAEFSSVIEFSNHHKELHTRLICDYCGKGYANKEKLTFHVQFRHCVKCGKSFKNSSLRKSHYNRHHPGFAYNSVETLELAYCVECDKQYGSVYQYQVHLRTARVHTNKPPKKVDRALNRRQCPACGKLCGTKATLERHYALIHTGKSKFQCKICNKYLFSYWGLQYHTRRVHEKLPLPKSKICDICERAFHAERTLANHRRTHTGERPFACVVCSAAFAQKTPLVTHMRKKHHVQDFTYKSIGNK